MNNNKQTELQIDAVFQNKCLFERLSDPEDNAKLDYSFKYRVKTKENMGISELILYADGINEKTGTPLFRSEISYIGVFSRANASEQDSLKDFLEYNAPAILMPYIRESLASLSVKAGLPPIVLPPLNIYNLLMPDDEAE